MEREDFQYGKFANAWCHGVGFNESLVRMALDDLLDDGEFSVMLKQYRIVMTKHLFPVFNRLFASKWPREDRLLAIKNVLAQKYEKYDIDGQINIYPYMYLRGIPNNAYKYSYIGRITVNKDLAFPKPHWSRENHSLVAFEGFTKICRCVLGMQRFRQVELPLPDRAIDHILENVFELQLRDFEDILNLRQKRFDQLKKLYDSGSAGREAVAKTCLNAGVLAFDWCQSFRDNRDRCFWFVVDDMLGIQIAHETLGQNWKSFTEEIYRIVYISPYLYSSKYLIGELIVDYCREHDIDLWMALKDGDRGKFKFKVGHNDTGVQLL